MDSVKLDFESLPFSPLFCDYIRGGDKSFAFFEHKHTYVQLKHAVESYRYPHDRKKSCAIIREFNRNFSLHKRAEENLKALEDEDTVTLTTGQQVNLFGGPLYTVLKTLSVIHLAKKLSKETRRHVVPVFWLADEDHDFDEIATVSLPNSKSVNRITLPGESVDHQAAGSIQVNDDFALFRTSVYNALPETDFKGELTNLLNDCYSKGCSFRNAFGQFMAHLFSKYGLVFAGSNDLETKKFTSDIIKVAIQQADSIRSVLSKQSEHIGAVFHQQAQVLDSLLFWHDDTEGRVRMKHLDGKWHRNPDIALSTDQLLRELDKNPDRFSPNVFLRPVIQDTLLPNVAYIGGPAEIAYFGQMKPLYHLFQQKMPFIAGRLSATMMEPSIARIFNELPFKLSDYARRIEDLEQTYLKTLADPEADHHFDDWKQSVEALTNRMTQQIGVSDPGLQNHSKALTKEHQKAIDKFRQKWMHTIRQKEEVQINRIRKIKHALFPNDHLQEREISFIYFINKYGLDIWDRVLILLETEADKPRNRQTDELFSQHYLFKL
ncbi:MAG: bacillithiol biosynthesis cysteine-adding enzyme BshC [Balneolales bacterium]